MATSSKTNPRRKRIRTALYHDQRFSKAELDILHTPSIQRLYDLRQLGFTDRVFIDASHTRLAHVIGVMEIATRLCISIHTNLSDTAARRGVLRYSDSQTNPDSFSEIACSELAANVDERIPAIRMMALLHDITHAPFGHTLEDEIHLVQPSHDAPDRQASAFLRVLAEYLSWTALDSFPPSRVRELNSTIPIEQWLTGNCNESSIDGLAKLGILLMDRAQCPKLNISRDDLLENLLSLRFAFRALLYLEVSHKDEEIDSEIIPKISYPADIVLEKIFSSLETQSQKFRSHQTQTSPKSEPIFNPQRDAFCLDIIGDTICADLLDYANRDATQAGLPLAFDLDRIIEHFTVVGYRAEKQASNHPFRGTCLRAAVDFSSRKFRGDIVGELIELLQVRYYVYERMLFHPTKCVAGAMLGRAAQLLGIRDMPSDLQLVGDSVFLNTLMEAGEIALRAASVYCSQTAPSPTAPRGVLPSDLSSIIQTTTLLNQTIAGRTARELLAQRGLRIIDLRKRLCGKRPPWICVAYLKLQAGTFTAQKLAATKAFAAYIAKLPIEADKLALDAERLGNFANSIIANQIAPDEHIQSFDRRDIVEAISHLAGEVNDIPIDLAAGNRTLLRLRSRRYAKRIFCVMPRTIRSAGIEIPIKDFADYFLDPTFRSCAEQAIEDLAGIPRGSVFIHCPPGKGPVKIAKVLLTYIPPASDSEKSDDYETRRHTKRLENIGSIEGTAGGLFTDHETHVKSLQNMYTSMWRLWVAVNAPDDRDYKRVSEVVCRVLSCFVFLGITEHSIENDVFYIDELKETYNDGSESLPPTSTETRSAIQPSASKADVFERVVKDRAAIVMVSDTSVDRDQLITKDELEVLFTRYLEILPRKSRKQFQEYAEKNRLLERIVDAQTTHDIRTFLRNARIPTALNIGQWEARNGEKIIEALEECAGISSATTPDPLTRKQRRLDEDDRKIASDLAGIIRAEISAYGSRTASGACALLKVAKRMGVGILFQPLLGVGGLYGGHTNTPIILLNSHGYDLALLQRAVAAEENSGELLPASLRFTLAHEIVHHIIAASNLANLGDGKDALRMRDIVELQCNLSAAALLAPDSEIDGLLKPGALSADSVRRLCASLGIHISAFTIRLREHQGFQSPNFPGFAVIYASVHSDSKPYAIRAGANGRAITRFPWLKALARNLPLPFPAPKPGEMKESQEMLELPHLLSEATSSVRVRLTYSWIDERYCVYVVEVA